MMNQSVPALPLEKTVHKAVPVNLVFRPFSILLPPPGVRVAGDRRIVTAETVRREGCKVGITVVLIRVFISPNRVQVCYRQESTTSLTSIDGSVDVPLYRKGGDGYLR